MIPLFGSGKEYDGPVALLGFTLDLRQCCRKIGKVNSPSCKMEDNKAMLPMEKISVTEGNA